MAKRDPNKTARNRMRAGIKVQLRLLLPKVTSEIGMNEASVNATIGSKTDDLFDLQKHVFHSQDQFVGTWLQRMKSEAENGHPGFIWIWSRFNIHPNFRQYLILFLKRSFLTHFDELAKNRPVGEDSAVWIGQKNAEYGLLVTPRFKNGQWENDKSEVRAFSQPYWTIGHILKTGLVVAGHDDKIEFSSADEYLKFFQQVLVRNSGSKYEHQIAGHYRDFVLAQQDPLAIPLLIPEYRYLGIAPKHEYRLDFMVINPYTLNKVGFELSPWSSHGKITGTKSLNQQEINDIASGNFEKEMRKHRAYFKKHNVVCLIYTDASLKDTKSLFDDEITPLLLPEKPQVQLPFTIIEEYLAC